MAVNNFSNDSSDESVKDETNLYLVSKIDKYLGKISGSGRKLQRYIRNKEKRRKQNYRRNNSVNAVSSQIFNNAELSYISDDKA